MDASRGKKSIHERFYRFSVVIGGFSGRGGKGGTKENYFPPSFDPARYAYVKVRKKKTMARFSAAYRTRDPRSINHTPNVLRIPWMRVDYPPRQGLASPRPLPANSSITVAPSTGRRLKYHPFRARRRFSANVDRIRDSPGRKDAFEGEVSMQLPFPFLPLKIPTRWGAPVTSYFQRRSPTHLI